MRLVKTFPSQLTPLEESVHLQSTVRVPWCYDRRCGVPVETTTQVSIAEQTSRLNDPPQKNHHPAHCRTNTKPGGVHVVRDGVQNSTENADGPTPRWFPRLGRRTSAHGVVVGLARHRLRAGGSGLVTSHGKPMYTTHYTSHVTLNSWII